MVVQRLFGSVRRRSPPRRNAAAVIAEGRKPSGVSLLVSGATLSETSTSPCPGCSECRQEDTAISKAPARASPQTVDPAQGSPFDTTRPGVVFEAVGVPGILDDVLRRARPGSRLVVAGVCMQPDTVHPFFAIAKEINVQFVLAYTPEEFGDSLRALAEGEIDATPVITGEVGLDAVGTAFDDLADPERHCKVLVTP